MVALHRDDARTSPPSPLSSKRPGGATAPNRGVKACAALTTQGDARPRLRIIAPVDAPLPYVPASMLVDAVEFRDEGCEFAASCLACPFDLCKYDDPAAFYKLDTTRRDREIALLRRKHRAPIDMLMQTYGLSRRQIFRVLREQGVTKQAKKRNETKKARPKA